MAKITVIIGEDFSAPRAEPDHVYHFDAKGCLVNWPFGWFEFFK